MPANERSAALTDRYRQALATLRSHGQAIARGAWQIDPANLDASHARWVAQTAPALAHLQATGTRLSAAYMAAYTTSETGQPPQTPPPATPTGEAQDGQPLSEALQPSLFTIKAQIGEGHPVALAIAAGLARALRTSSDQAVAPARQELADAIAEQPHVIGWRRVARPGACGACLASMSGEVEHAHAQLHVHPFCDCIQEPVIAGVEDAIVRPTGRELFMRLAPDEQDQRLGADKAKLIRTGAVPFHALIQRDPMAVVPDAITEAPLEALEHHLQHNHP